MQKNKVLENVVISFFVSYAVLLYYRHKYEKDVRFCLKQIGGEPIVKNMVFFKKWWEI